MPFRFSPSPYMPEAPVQHQDTVKMNLVRVKIQNILNAVGGKESNVGYPTEYWFLQNLLRFYLRQPL